MNFCRIFYCTLLSFTFALAHGQTESLAIFTDHEDIGAVKHAGDAQYADGTYTLSGSGTNMWLEQDEFHFVYKVLRGDFTVSAQVEFVGDGVDPHRKIGWVARENLSTGSPMVNASTHGDGLTALQYRLEQDSLTQESKSEVQGPTTLTLQRRGSTFLMISTSDTISTQAVLSQDLYVGIYVCSHNPDVIETANFRNVSIQMDPPDLDVSDLRWRNIGPANMMGRIASIDALDTDYRHVVMASASGGVFKSTNGGINWDVIFDNHGASSIGCAVINQSNPDIIWVGTGESANRNSSGWGNGIFKSEDGGKSFRYVGLKESHNVAEIALHPTDPEIAYAAVVGHLWGYKGIRGLYYTEDGGNNWQKITNGLPDDGNTGCTEIVMHPDDPNTLFAGFYHRLRQPATFQSGGENGGLYKSTDGGKSWRKITKGLAEGSSGMIDISIHRANPDIIAMAYEAEEALNLVRDSIGNSVPGSGVYKSMDGGESWEFLLPHAVRPFYHGQIKIDPVDPNNIYVVSRGFKESHDGGKTFQDRKGRADGGDDHDMWIAPHDNKYMYLATDQGFRFSNDGGENYLSYNNMAIGQYYAIGVDMKEPYRVAGGLQDNGLWVATTNSRNPRGILNRDNYWIGEGDGFHVQIDPTDWRTTYMVNHVGFCVRLNSETREYHYITPTPETTTNFSEFVDYNYPETRNIYTIDPGEHWFFYERAERPLMPPQFRFNWSSPLVMSPTDPNTIYFGSNHLFKSTDQGNHWQIISPDLTTNDSLLRNTSHGGGLTFSNTGGENHFTIITISESPKNGNVVWVGTDDGNVQVSKNGGVVWENVKLNIPDIPEKIWVSRVEASHFDDGTCYVTFDNHRYDDNKAYLFKTTDYGKTWADISSNLPDDYSLYVVREDLENPDLLFVGSESTIYYSIDGGMEWKELSSRLPNVAIYDLVIHPREGDLVAGTHGRSIWILDDISPLRQWREEISTTDLYVFDPKPATRWQQVRIGRTQPAFEYRGENPPNAALVHFYLPDSAEVSIEITGDAGKNVTHTVKGHAGINRFMWNFKFPLDQVELGNYKEHLSTVIETLGSRVQNDALQASLPVIADSLSTASTMQELNKIRSKLVEDFSGYAAGESLFGAKQKAHMARPGNYQVNIRREDNQMSKMLEVKEDPILAER